MGIGLGCGHAGGFLVTHDIVHGHGKWLFAFTAVAADANSASTARG
jgi:hypothetical protein